MASQAAAPQAVVPPRSPTPPSELGPRHQLTYQQWVGLLEREARAAVDRADPRLTILAGDSISLWFPLELLPADRTWLNQAISGETSDQLRRRLHLFDATRPTLILVMIGINDLRQGYATETVVANQRAIVQHLKTAHPQARLVLQSVLPHAGDRWQDARVPAWAVRLAALPNSRIRRLNRQLAELAQAEGIEFLDLYPDFADAAGNLLSGLSTDGLHLSRAGYEVWQQRLAAYLAGPPSARPPG